MGTTAVLFGRKYTFILFTFLESILYFCYVFRKFFGGGGKNLLLMSKMGLFLKYEDPTG